MDRIECEWCKEQNEPNRTDCVKCGAPLFARDRISDPRSNQINVAFSIVSQQRVVSDPVVPVSRKRASGMLWMIIIIGLVGLVVPLVAVVIGLSHHHVSSLSSRGSVASVPQGGKLTVGSNDPKTVACNDGYLTVLTNSKTFTVTGHCSRLDVVGNSNDVTVDRADTIHIVGKNNTVTYHSGTPSLNTFHSSNTVEQG